jgi:membrane protein
MAALFTRIIASANEFQQRFPPLGFSYAVIRKYGEDSGARLAALLTYYGFLSSIPILLIVVWAISQILRGDPSLRDQFISVVVPDSLSQAVSSALAAMPTSPLPLIIGIVGLVFTGNGIVFTGYEIINNIQGVPYRNRLGFVPRYVRALTTLLVLFVTIAALGGITLAATRVDLGGAEVILGLIASWAVLVCMLLACVALLSSTTGSWRAAWPGAIIGGAILTIVLSLGGWLLSILVGRSGSVYGPFAAVVGMFTLLYFVSQGLVFAAQIAVVRRKKLWPRSLVPTQPTEADRAALLLRSRIEERTEADRVAATMSSAGGS